MSGFAYNILNELDYGSVSVILILLFALLYFTLSISFHLVVNWLLKKGVVQKVTTTNLFNHQFRFEILHSLMSIVIFGLYGLLIILCYRNKIVSIAFENDYMVFIDLLILALWNELHFYLLHKLMHTKLFIKIHRTHHKSIVVTPFSTYSFHPIESLIFGTVMILPMLVIEFEFLALLIFPIYHLFFNTLGHSNVKFIKRIGGIKQVEISTQHNNHHTKYSSNFGFVTSFVDRLLNTYYKTKN